jgi:hypothetical protein
VRRSATDLHFSGLVNVVRGLSSAGRVCHTRHLHPPAIDRDQPPRGPEGSSPFLADDQVTRPEVDKAPPRYSHISPLS